MELSSYLQSSYTGNIYKVMDQYLLQMSPWKDGEDRRLFEYDDEDMHVITYQNACMIVNKQFAETDEEWEHNGKRYRARALVNKNIDEHTAMLSMLPSHYIKETKQLPSDSQLEEFNKPKAILPIDSSCAPPFLLFYNNFQMYFL